MDTKRPRENDGVYGTGISFEEPNLTGSRPRDMSGLSKPTSTRNPTPTTHERARRKQTRKPGSGREGNTVRANGNHEGGRRRVTEGGLEEQHGLRESLRRGQPWDLVVSHVVTI